MRDAARRARRAGARAGVRRDGSGAAPPERHATAAGRPVAHPPRHGLAAGRAARHRRWAICSTTGGPSGSRDHERPRHRRHRLPGTRRRRGAAGRGPRRRAVLARGVPSPGCPAGPIDGDIRDRPALAAPLRCLRRHHPQRGAGGRVAAARPRLRRGERRRPGQRPRGGAPGRHRARALHLVVPGAAAGRPGPRAGLERLPAHEGGRRSPGRRSRRAGRAAHPPVPRRHLRPGPGDRRQPGRPHDCRSSAGPPARRGRRRPHLVVLVRRRCRRRARRGADRGRAWPALSARRRGRAADARVRHRPRADGPAAAAPAAGVGGVGRRVRRRTARDVVRRPRRC